jgi:uncharacterized protein (DUF433 family)
LIAPTRSDGAWPERLPEAIALPYAVHEMAPEQKLSVDQIVVVSPHIMHGAACFAGTRVPVQTLLDYVAEGDTLDAFLADFPSVKREQAIGLLALAQERLLESISR